MDNSEIIHDYILKNDETSEYKVARFMSANHHCARDTTHNLIYNKLIPEGKIIDKKIGNGFHKLCINDKNMFNQVNRAIKEIEDFVNDKKQYLGRRIENIQAEIDEIYNKEIVDEESERKMGKWIQSFGELERNYKQTITKMLEDLFVIANDNDKISKQDSERLYNKIIELKSKIAYYKWDKKIELSYYNLQIKNINNFRRIIEDDKTFAKHLEQTQLDTKFMKPYQELIHNFKLLLE